LAAGESRRFGSPKQLARLGERTILEHVLALADVAGLTPVVAVVPVWLTRPASADERLVWVRNPHPQRGMSYSLKLGFDALADRAQAAIILLGDQPTLPRSAIAALLASRGDRPIVAGWANGRPTPPVLIERTLFGVVAEASGDSGLRELLLAHPEWVAAVELPAAAADVDTPDDLQAIGKGS
jgi:CTP:molybdopterin cytidylyltransferase MocA